MKTSPYDCAFSSGQKDANSQAWIIDGGLTKREYFALHIYAGMSGIPDSLDNRQINAQTAVMCADALIEALNTEPQG
jgi:hypothetical protein